MVLIAQRGAATASRPPLLVATPCLALAAAASTAALTRTCCVSAAPWARAARVARPAAGPASCVGGRVDDVVLGSALSSEAGRAAFRAVLCVARQACAGLPELVRSRRSAVARRPNQARCPSRFYRYKTGLTPLLRVYIPVPYMVPHYGVTGPTISRLQGCLPPRRTANCTSVAIDAYRPRVMLTISTKSAPSSTRQLRQAPSHQDSAQHDGCYC